jgi:dihydroorotate dehydrogenase electron transfer subunit
MPVEQRASPAFHSLDCRVVSNRAVGPDWYVLRLEGEAIARASRPGQFVQILCAAPGLTWDPLLRRPFSVYDADAAAGTFDILYVVTGRGTRWMAELPEHGAPLPGTGTERGRGVVVDTIGPFGNRFTTPCGAEDIVVLVGGGVGVAPLYSFARELTAAGAPTPPRIVLLMGARTESQLQGIDDFRRLPIETHVATNDGSSGHRGVVTELLEHLLEQPEAGLEARRLRVYGCGPTGMNASLREVTVRRGLRAEICLESRMACGFGVCFACVVPIRRELGGELYNRRICTEGCVFDARLLASASEMARHGPASEGPICPTLST